MHKIISTFFKENIFIETTDKQNTNNKTSHNLKNNFVQSIAGIKKSSTFVVG